MIYIEEILKKNRTLVLGYLALGIFNAFMLNLKADVFQKVVDGLTRQDITLVSIWFYGGILIVSYCMNYLDNYPEKKLEHSIYLDFKLLALARLWFREPKLVILDEATSAMDNLTEEAVMGEVMTLLREQTVIAVVHRLNTVVNFDRIVVFRQGEIVGQGTFAQLMERNEYFRELYHASMRV